MTSRPLQTTHYGLLAVLSLGPATAYELVRQMERSVGVIWPRAQSNLYADLKRLAADGLADTEVSHVGKRPSTTYAITRAGRHVLEAWLAAPGAVPAFECEALLKLAFAPLTTKDAALAQIDVLAEHAGGRVALGRALAEEHVAGGVEGAPFPERLHVNAVLWRFLHDLHATIDAWAQWARTEVDAWPDTQDHPDLRTRGLAVLREALAEG